MSFLGYVLFETNQVKFASNFVFNSSGLKNKSGTKQDRPSTNRVLTYRRPRRGGRRCSTWLGCPRRPRPRARPRRCRCAGRLQQRNPRFTHRHLLRAPFPIIIIITFTKARTTPPLIALLSFRSKPQQIIVIHCRRGGSAREKADPGQPRSGRPTDNNNDDGDENRHREPYRTFSTCDAAPLAGQSWNGREGRVGRARARRHDDVGVGFRCACN